jgi:symplekin
MEACSACFAPALRDLFSADALAVALQQLVELSPLPLLFMRTVIQTASVAPKLHGFILELLSKLVLKQLWKSDPKLWQGVLRCAKQLVPRSFSVFLQLPPVQLQEALAQFPDLVAPLTLYAGMPAVRATVPGATLAVLTECAAPTDTAAQT